MADGGHSLTVFLKKRKIKEGASGREATDRGEDKAVESTGEVEEQNKSCEIEEAP